MPFFISSNLIIIRRRAVNILLIDIGNTTCDFRLYKEDESQLIKLIRPGTDSTLMANPKNVIAALPPYTYDLILYVSVVPKIEAIITELGALLALPTFNMRNHLPRAAEDFQLNNLSELGADFIANFYGFYAHYPEQNGVIASFGTATTLFVVQNNRFVGTTIAPGLQSSLEALLKNAALLTEMDYQASDKLMATNTFDAINIGTINGHYYMVMGLIEAIKEQNPIEKILFTGGNATYFTHFAKKRGIVIDEELIFKGLIHLYKESIAPLL